MIRKKVKEAKKICFKISEEDLLKLKDLRKKAEQNGFEIDLESEFRKFFVKSLKKMDLELKKVLNEAQRDDLKTEEVKKSFGFSNS